MATRGRKAKAKGLTKTEVLSEVADKSGLTRAQVGGVFDALAALVAREIGGGKPFTVPGLVKISVQSKPATKAREGRNPFTGEPMTIKAKPARRVVRVRPIKALKEMA